MAFPGFLLLFYLKQSIIFLKNERGARMLVIPFETLYYTDFFIKESFAKYQNWYSRGNFYSCLGKPKPSHTLLWFKNASGKITNADGKITIVHQNQLTYMAKTLEYRVDFFNTAPEQVDSVVIHFQMTDINGRDIAPSLRPELCIKNVDDCCFHRSCT